MVAKAVATVLLLVACISCAGTQSSIQDLKPQITDVGKQSADGKVQLPPNPKTIILGDSFTFGTGAEPVEAGYAYLVKRALGGDATVDGVSGSGWVNGAASGATYGQRLAEVPMDETVQLLILQGGINDQPFRAQAFKEIISSIDIARLRYPSAEIVLFGPIAGKPADRESVASINAINDVIFNASVAKNVKFIDAMTDPWITLSNFKLMTSDDGVHPSNAGHELIASKVIAELG